MTMTIEDISKIFYDYVEQRGYKIEMRPSDSTNSYYFHIFSGNTSLMFRVSDHKTTRNIITLRTDKKLTRESVKNFIINRCNDLSYRRVKEFLGMRA